MPELELDYPTSSINLPRYSLGKTNPHIDRVLKAGHHRYLDRLLRFRQYFDALAHISAHPARQSVPYYCNPYLPGLDAVALYCLLAELRPATYLEIGSGNSTKFARQSVNDNKLPTRIITVDPYLSDDISFVSDEHLRVPLEDVDIQIFDQLQPNDILFIDNSHRCFMNSDVTVVFLEVMPRLEPNVYVHLHDIFWPLDYPESFADRYYNEQYVLGALLANGLPSYEIVLPNFYVSLQPELNEIIGQLWDSTTEFADVERHGCSFWMRRVG